jgi:hypothetical protein
MTGSCTAAKLFAIVLLISCPILACADPRDRAVLSPFGAILVSPRVDSRVAHWSVRSGSKAVVYDLPYRCPPPSRMSRVSIVRFSFSLGSELSDTQSQYGPIILNLHDRIKLAILSGALHVSPGLHPITDSKLVFSCRDATECPAFCPSIFGRWESSRQRELIHIEQRENAGFDRVTSLPGEKMIMPFMEREANPNYEIVTDLWDIDHPFELATTKPQSEASDSLLLDRNFVLTIAPGWGPRVWDFTKGNMRRFGEGPEADQQQPGHKRPR